MAQINMATEDWVNAQGFAKEGTVFHYMGSVATVAALDSVSSPSVGDVYNVTATGSNYVWTGTPGVADKPNQIGWDKLSETIVVSDSFTSNITDQGDDADKAVKSSAVKSALDGKVDKVTGKGLSTEDFTTAEKTKLDNSVEIDSVDSAQMSIDTNKKLSITAIAQSVVTGLSDTFATKVDKVTGKGLSTEDFTTAEKTKLDAMVEVDSVDTDQMTIDSTTKKLSITAIAQSVVTGLSDSLGGKVDKVEGKGLSTNDLTDARKNKLDNSVEIDSVESTQMSIDANKKLSITAIAQSVVTGLSDSLGGKVDKAEGYGLSKNDLTDVRATKLDALAEIKSVDANTLAISAAGQLSVTAVSSSIVTGLSDALNGKVDKVEGKGLSTNDLTDTRKNKLDAMVEIDAVDTAQMSIDASTKKLSITAVAQSVVTGLSTSLDGKVDKVTGKGLSTEDFTTALKTKLDNSVEIDSVESTQMSIDSSTKKLSITAVAQSVVTGLADALGGKVDKAEGYALSKNDLTDTRAAKLDAMVEIDSVDTNQMTIDTNKKLSVTAIAQSVVTGLGTALSDITTDITNICNGTKAFTGLKFAYNNKYYTLAVATNSVNQPTLYLEEIVAS